MTLSATRPAAAGRTLLLVPTVGADCRSVVTALTGLADAYGRAVVVVPPHRLLAAAAELPGAPIAILTVSPQRAAEEAMASGLPPSAALAALAAEQAAIKHAAEQAAVQPAAQQAAVQNAGGDHGRIRLVPLAELEAEPMRLAALLDLPGSVAADLPPLLRLRPPDALVRLLAEAAATAAAGDGGAPAAAGDGGTPAAAGDGGTPAVGGDALAVVDEAFRRHRALSVAAAEGAALRSEANRAALVDRDADRRPSDSDADRRHPDSDVDRRHPGSDVDRRDAEIAALSAERDRLAEEVARLGDALARAAAAAAGAERPRVHAVTLGEDFAHPAFHDLERNGPDRIFRWFGREQEATLATAVPRRSSVRVDVHVEMAISNVALDDFAIGMDDTFAAETTVTPGERGCIVSAVFPGDPAVHTLARRRLHLRAGHRVDLTARGDPRTLAVAISRIVLEEGPEGPVDAPRPPEREAPRTVGLEQLVHPAFHDLERRPDGLAYRWLGRLPRAEIPVRLRPGRTVRVTVRLAGAISQEALRGVAFGLDGVDAEAPRLEDDGAGGATASALFHLADDGPLAGNGPLASDGSGGERTVRLHLAAPVRQGVPGGDPRPLSVAVHAIVVEPVEEAGEGGEQVATVPPPAAPSPGTAMRVSLGTQRGLAVPAFYGVERLGRRPFRWMGREERAEFALPLPPGRPLWVTAEILIAIDAAAVEGFGFALDGRPPAAVVVEHRPGGVILKSAFFPAVASPAVPPAAGAAILSPAAGAAGTAPRLTLLAANRTDLTPRGDPRTLAVGLGRLDVDVV